MHNKGLLSVHRHVALNFVTQQNQPKWLFIKPLVLPLWSKSGPTARHYLRKNGHTYWKTDVCSLRVNSTHLKNGLDASGTRPTGFTCPNNAPKSSCPYGQTMEWTCCFMGFMTSGHYRTFSVLCIFVITRVLGAVLKGSYDKLGH